MRRLQTPIRLGSGLVLERRPQTDFELWVTTRALWGLQIPRVRVCAGHQAPFQTFADNFFGRESMIVLKGSRGLSGKSYMGAGLGLTNSVLWGVKTNVLGGSGAQSINVHQHMAGFWSYWNSPKHMLADEPTKLGTKLINGGRIDALMASTGSVRGPHPARLLLDEIDEMESNIFHSAMGMPLSQVVHKDTPWEEEITPATLAVSTHQYPNGTMSEVLKLAKEKGWPVRQHCFRESANPIDGWLSVELIHQKRREISKEMWRIEYELGEPAIEGRAVDSKHVQKLYDINREWEFGGQVRTGVVFEGRSGKEYVFQDPEPNVMYVTGVDWARTKDWTVIDTWRTDTWERVAWLRVQKMPWPVMIGMAIRRFMRYPGHLAHDATGLGDVIAGVFPDGLRNQNQIHDIVMSGPMRSVLFSEFVTACEQDTFRSPYIEPAHDDLLYVTHDDLYRSGTKYHPPDSVVAHALAWHLRGEKKLYAAPATSADLLRNEGEGWYLPDWHTEGGDDVYDLSLTV